MKCKGLDGKIHTITVDASKNGLKDANTSRSKFQYNCGQLLKAKWPFTIILEELYIPSEKMYLDFFLPHLKIVVEVQGEQHNRHVPFYQTKAQFASQQNKDANKEEWCIINGFTIIKVNSEEELSTWLATR